MYFILLVGEKTSEGLALELRMTRRGDGGGGRWCRFSLYEYKRFDRHPRRNSEGACTRISYNV